MDAIFASVPTHSEVSEFSLSWLTAEKNILRFDISMHHKQTRVQMDNCSDQLAENILGHLLSVG